MQRRCTGLSATADTCNISVCNCSPTWGRGTPSPLSIHFLIFCSFLLFPFSFSHSLYLFSSFVHPFPFTARVVALHFQAGGHRRRPNLGLVCFVYFVTQATQGIGTQWLLDLCNGIVKEGCIPEDWKSSVVYYPFTKGKVIQWSVDLTGGLNCWNML